MTTNEKDPQAILRNAMESFLSDALEALMLMIEEEVAKTHSEPEPDPRESLPDYTPVGHGWVTAWYGRHLYKQHSQGRLTRWYQESNEWGDPGQWRDSQLIHPRPATVGNLRHVGLPVTEWPDITPPNALPDDTPVGHGWVMDEDDLFKPESDGRFTLWFPGISVWGDPGFWMGHELGDSYIATVGDLRRKGVPPSEWPDIETQENA